MFGSACPCGRKPAGCQNKRVVGAITHSVLEAGKPTRFVCAECANEAPFFTVVRPLSAPRSGVNANPKMVGTWQRRRAPSRAVE